MFLGIDLGTSGVKALLVDHDERVLAEATAPLDVQRPRPLWSEQDPAAWWRATVLAVAELRAAAPAGCAAIEAIGLSGQMHGAVLLGAAGTVLRPAILWNDGRSGEECTVLEGRAPALRAIAGNAAMPGFTAPKLLWVAAHEPETFGAIAKVLLPKDWLRYRMTGEMLAEMSDAAGTLWLDVAGRTWSGELIAASGMRPDQLAPLVEGSAPAGRLTATAAAELGLAPGILLAGGGADNAAAAIGVGAVQPGRAFLSLGTSGVLLSPTLSAEPDPAQGVHAFCHAVPDRWYRMAVFLSAAASLTYAAQLLGTDEAGLVAEAGQAPPDPHGPIFLPYLSGERTPHNDPYATGVFFGLTHAAGRPQVARAVLEGVALSFADGRDCLGEVGEITLIGGGARSSLWGTILASALGQPLYRTPRGALGPALGAARLARLAATGETVETVCKPAPSPDRIDPDDASAAALGHKRPLFRDLYRDLKPLFRRLRA